MRFYFISHLLGAVGRNGGLGGSLMEPPALCSLTWAGAWPRPHRWG